MITIKKEPFNPTIFIQENNEEGQTFTEVKDAEIHLQNLGVPTLITEKLLAYVQNFSEIKFNRKTQEILYPADKFYGRSIYNF